MNKTIIINILIIFIITVSSVGNCHGLNFWEFLIGPRLSRDNFKETNISIEKTTAKIVKSYGYRLDTHLVTSKTGHILTLHRIPSGRTYCGNQQRPIALIHHGLFGCSDMWLLRGPHYDLPYILADAGYDVWLFNTRGNVYSRQHETLDPDRDVQYWDFGIEEMGYYDLPATIDYILNVTDEKSIFFLGHSIGSSAGFIMCSLLPQYNHKIRLFLALGPLANVKHKLNPTHKIIFLLGSRLMRFIESQNIYEIMPRRVYVSKMVQMACADGSFLQRLCLMLIFAVVGEDFHEFNTATFPRFVQYYPSGTSSKVLMDIFRYYTSGDFAKSNFGSNIMNVLRYNTSNYNLSRVTTPVSLHYGEGDFLVTEEDIDDLVNRLRNVVGKHKVPHKHFNHLDFVLATNAKSLLYENLLNEMDKYR